MYKRMKSYTFETSVQSKGAIVSDKKVNCFDHRLNNNKSMVSIQTKVASMRTRSYIGFKQCPKTRLLELVLVDKTTNAPNHRFFSSDEIVSEIYQYYKCWTLLKIIPSVLA